MRPDSFESFIWKRKAFTVQAKRPVLSVYFIRIRKWKTNLWCAWFYPRLDRWSYPRQHWMRVHKLNSRKGLS